MIDSVIRTIWKEEKYFPDAKTKAGFKNRLRVFGSSSKASA
jgi:hypothetical protein